MTSAQFKMEQDARLSQDCADAFCLLPLEVEPPSWLLNCAIDWDDAPHS